MVFVLLIFLIYFSKKKVLDEKKEKKRKCEELINPFLVTLKVADLKEDNIIALFQSRKKNKRSLSYLLSFNA